jgi:hypothetical protein
LRNGEIIIQSERASTDHGFNDLPRLTIVIRKRDLTGTSVVGCTSLNGHLASATSLVRRLGHVRSCLLVVTFAWKI